MSTEVEKIKTIYEKVSLLVSTIQDNKKVIEELTQENNTLTKSNAIFEALNSSLKQEMENLKTVDSPAFTIETKVDNKAKITGMIKEIDECLALLSS